MIFQHRL